MDINNAFEKCPHEGCGGCKYQDTPYEEQAAAKDAEVRALLETGGVEPGAYLGIAGSPAVTAYRNKMDYTFGDEFKGGPLTLGMHRRRSFMSVLTADRCRLVHEDFNKILAATLEFCKDSGYAAYNKKTHKGLMRNLVLRRGVRTGELLANIVTSSQESFDEEGFLGAIRGLTLENSICGVLHTINDNIADFVYADETRVLAGRDYYMEEILGLKFKVNAFSFFQTNVAAAERLYAEALSWIEELSEKSAYDLYCGAGTITQVLARQAGEVTGVELSPEAVADAKGNARINNLSNCRFIQGDVLEVLDKIGEPSAASLGRPGAMGSHAPDIVVLDPPRVGVHPKALGKIAGLGAKEMVYISCNPKSFVENLRFLYGTYRVVQVKAFDNFPFTGHIEAAAHLEIR